MPYVLAIVLLLALLLVGPVLTIAMLNTLFGTGLTVTLGTYFATVWLHTLVFGSAVKKKG